MRVKRSPQAASGVASSRIWWRRRPLRSTTSTWVRPTGGAPRCSSTQRTLPPRTRISSCEKIQSATWVSPAASPDRSMPPTSSRPCAVRRTSSTGWSMTNCSTPPCSSEATEKATSVRGTSKPACPAGSCTRRSCSDTAGTRPFDSARSAPMVTGVARAREARVSSRGRNWSIRGTMTQCRAAQARIASSTSATATRDAQRIAMAATLIEDWINGVPAGR